MSDTVEGRTTHDGRRSGLLPTTAGCLFGGLISLVVLLGAAVAAAVAFTGWPPTLNPFQEETVDRTGASVITSLTDLSEYHAASAHYETVVDIENDVRFIPGWVSGERVLYVGKGDVNAVVDFGELDDRRVELSEDETSVTITLPAPTADRPVLDLENSYVAHRDEGLVTRFRGSELERDAQLRAVEQMTAAAGQEDMLIDQAKANTTAMLRGLFGSLGYTTINVEFDENVD
ncbi:DUF4230 domain-containing protein [Serinicoccus sp. LYQ131]|uniref:DUF4230 domain-containing protein n=1 Tax=Serinicoccus sp. LYQ131 TaxID=3378797 RepID=UPI0038525206